jgi:hypothetical protein
MPPGRYRDFALERDPGSGLWEVTDPYDQHLGQFPTEKDAQRYVDGLLGGSRLKGLFGAGLAGLMVIALLKLFLKGGLMPLIGALFSKH